jgi:hypothetical protein
MARVLRGYVRQLVNEYMGNGACHYSLTFAASFNAEFALEDPSNLVAVDDYKWLDSSIDETDPAERPFIGGQTSISPHAAISTKFDLNDVKEFRGV